VGYPFLGRTPSSCLIQYREEHLSVDNSVVGAVALDLMEHLEQQPTANELERSQTEGEREREQLWVEPVRRFRASQDDQRRQRLEYCGVPRGPGLPPEQHP
jgi:hypothetical protein